jgi:hypothetical protein
MGPIQRGRERGNSKGQFRGEISREREEMIAESFVDTVFSDADRVPAI